MGGLPDVVIVIDTNREGIAVKESKTLNIPVIAVLDSNSTPDDIAFPIPGNDDATRAINLYCDLFSGAVLEGIQEDLARQGVALEGAEATPATSPSADSDPEVLPASETASPKPKADAASSKVHPTKKFSPKPLVEKKSANKKTVAKPLEHKNQDGDQEVN